MAVLGYDSDVIGYDSSAYSYDGLFLGGMLRFDDLFIPVQYPRLTDPDWPGENEGREFLGESRRPRWGGLAD